MCDVLHVVSHSHPAVFSIFFLNDPPTTEIYTLSLHDALPISRRAVVDNHHPVEHHGRVLPADGRVRDDQRRARRDRKSTRLNSSHMSISYAVFCLKKEKKKNGHHLLIEDGLVLPPSPVDCRTF